MPAVAQMKPYSLPGTALPVPAVPPASPPTAPAPGASVATPSAPEGTLNRLFNQQLPEAIGNSRITFDARLRWEFADQDAVGAGPDPDHSNALTLRTRLGLLTAPFHGFQAMIEGENVVALAPDHNYNAAGSNSQPGRTVIADPETTELNQAWLSYSRWNSVLKAGRQRIVLDNHRFIGDVGWRQNMQTYDAVAFQNSLLENLSFFYAYVWEVNRVFGDVDDLPAANRDFDSDSHIFNVSWSRWKYGRFTAYSYLLDLENSAPASAVNSTATYGGCFAGSAPLTETISLGYRAEFAWQTDHADNPADYGAEYWNVETGLTVRPVALGLGYEVLGADNGQGFKTPLATLHAFNGWADVFLNTPPDGLRDLYLFAQVSVLPDMPLRFVFHHFDADSGGNDYGSEYDLLLTKKLGKHWSALAKYAHYEADEGSYADTDRFWLEVSFTY